MQFEFQPMNDDDARPIAAWHYEPPYDFYDMAQDPDDLAELLDPQSRTERYYAIHDEQGSLVGLFTFIRVDAETLEIGLGLHPDLTGKKLGAGFLVAGLDFGRQHFAPLRFLLRVATFNTRAIRLYEKVGFRPVQTFPHRTNGGEFEFLSMIREA